jgi:hypothetical protein
MIMIYPVTFGGFYIYGLWRGLLSLASATAILTVVASLFVSRARRKERLESL